MHFRLQSLWSICLISVCCVFLLAPTTLPERAAATTQFAWKFAPKQQLHYRLVEQLRADGIANQGAANADLQLDAEISMRGIEDGSAFVEMKGRKTTAIQKPIETATPPQQGKTSSSWFSCGHVPEAEQPAQAPATTSAPPPSHFFATFKLGADGILVGDMGSAGGQTELMLQLLLPIPNKPLAPGEVETRAFAVTPAGERAPLQGTLTITYVGDETHQGHKLAKLVSQLQLHGAAMPLPAQNTEKNPAPAGALPPGVRSGSSIHIEATTEGLFDTVAGHYVTVLADSQLHLSAAHDGAAAKPVAVTHKRHSRLELLSLPNP